ncbi:hypothetical protein Q4512_04350 [Oceanihabitans sp. 2_MG-2023]|uniref:hypothetical protein n=1 Tax=Oceanihabitans sp. 2_MG-2023 TaxID=3062661 RepID=UPI0026E1F873|nr:hypothetical protein [Oceanihabitans sp. 2_MG-2023]MDO6596134.1 hypothetical protein [Oceanihabitans sp. 2_MG-2023]
MKKKHKTTLNFYKNLGNLFYAIAAADKSITPLEVITLKEIIKSKWLKTETLKDTFGTDSAYQIEFIFDILHRENNLDVEKCYADFINYKKAQNHFFSPSVNQLILQTANAIANSFSGKNKSELILLAKLEMELRKTDI